MSMPASPEPKAVTCPLCRQKQECQTPAFDTVGPPEPGAWSVCWNCGAINVYTAELELRLATEAERNELPAEVAWKIMVLQRRILAKAHPRVLGITAGKTIPGELGPCDRCGRLMHRAKPGAQHLGGLPAGVLDLPRVYLCTECLPKGTRELEPLKKGTVIRLPRFWHRERKRN